MNICLKCARFPFCIGECKFIKRGYDYEKLERKTEQKENESFQENLTNTDLTQEEDNSIAD